jgi:drug/metabolite transporter superfamily protein YnfA
VTGVTSVSQGLVFLILLGAAILEVGGDALVRKGLQSRGLVQQVQFILLGGLTLLSYGIVVNLPAWDFGKLLGIYVTLFFLVAQLINYFGFGQIPSISIWVGGALIVAGGLVITFWRV